MTSPAGKLPKPMHSPDPGSDPEPEGIASSGPTRFFVAPEQLAGDIVTLDEADAHHLRSVLHKAPGDPIQVLDGSGALWDAVLMTLGKSRATATLGTQSWPLTEPVTSITIAQALPKMNEKMEQVLQRGTEIGAIGFRAFESACSQTHLSGERQQKRLARWAAIVKTAAEQSRRARLPAIEATETLDDILGSAGDYDLALFAYERENATTLKAALRARASKPQSLLVIVGPESGFTPREESAARRAGAVPVSLGPRILRTETAAMVTVAQLLYELEE